MVYVIFVTPMLFMEIKKYFNSFQSTGFTSLCSVLHLHQFANQFGFEESAKRMQAFFSNSAFWLFCFFLFSPLSYRKRHHEF